MVEFEFNVDKARRTLGALGKGSENVMSGITTRRPDVAVPGERATSQKSVRGEREAAPTKRSGEIGELWEEIRDLKARIRRLENEASDGK
jgi:hypothetical protein